MVFRQLGTDKWRPLGEDGNAFDRSSEGRAEAWREAQAAANLGIPWAGASYRLVDVAEGDHADDCALGIGGDWCDCGVEPVIVEERVLLPEVDIVTDRILSEEQSRSHGLGRRVREITVRTRALSEAEASELGLGGLVVAGEFVAEDES